jgi:tetratricopeptide (TPR) repeat protein/pimeloyl-ACP methyl ester carboxylesterase
MSDVIKIVGPTEEPSATVVFVHGLGGHAYNTWRRGANSTEWAADPTFWPLWLARDCKRLAVYSIDYAAPVSRLRGSAMHFADQATNILARVLAEPALARGPLILIGHSLGGLVIKQLLRTAESTASYQAGAADLIRRVERIAFLATPHSGAGLATWGDRLRILARPSAATACLVRNDPGLRDLNNWYRDWSHGRGIAHLILAETEPTRILGTIVPPDSADPGLANVRSLPVGADHSGICKPADDTSDIYVFVRDFVSRPVGQPRQPLEAKLDTLPDVTARAVVAELQRLGIVANVVDGVVGEQMLLELARRLKPDEELTLKQAVVEVSAAVEIAANVIERGEHGANVGGVVDAVLARIAEKTRAGDFDGAARDADNGFAEWERAEAERLETSVRGGISLLEAGLEQNILRRDATAVARRVEKVVLLEHPDEGSGRFAAIRARKNTFYARGRDKGINFDLLVAIEIARLTLISANTKEERGTALNDLGSALFTLGERESGTARLEEAVTAYRDALKERTHDWAAIQINLGSALAVLGERASGTARLEEAVDAYRDALKEYTRERVPLGWAATQNNLGNALRALGQRESGTARLEEAVAAFRDALKEYTRKRVPLNWATTQNNLGNALSRLGERETGTARLEEAVAAYRDGLKEYTRERVPLGWAATQNNLGYALSTLGARASDTARLEEAVTAFRDALKEYTRERVPLDWAMAQNNLGNALSALGARESGTARLEEAVAAYRDALKERTRERVPLDWAMTQNNLGKAEKLLAERRK